MSVAHAIPFFVCLVDAFVYRTILTRAKLKKRWKIDDDMMFWLLRALHWRKPYHHSVSSSIWRSKMRSTKLIQYTHAVRRKYLKVLGELPWDEVVKDRGASYPSIKDIFLHALDAEDLLINHIVQSKYGKMVKQDYVKFTNIHQIEERVDNVERNVDAYLKTLTETELHRKVAFPWKPSFLLTVDDVLMTLAIEDTYHMGELIALMWQFDKEPPFLSWSTFLEQNP